MFVIIRNQSLHADAVWWGKREGVREGPCGRERAGSDASHLQRPPDVMVWVPLEADPETRILGQAVSLVGSRRKHEEGRKCVCVGGGKSLKSAWSRK